MKIQFKQSPTGRPYFMAYSVGQIAEISDKAAQELIDKGIATPYTVKNTTQKAVSAKAATAEKRAAKK